MMEESDIEDGSCVGVRVEKRIWYAMYTRSRSEKKALQWLTEDGIEAYLPMYKVLKQWSDRKKWVEQPLVPSYIFVKVSKKEFFTVLNTPYVVSYVSFAGKAAAIREQEIEMMKLLMEDTANHPELVTTNISKGDLVEITGGAMKGAIGEVVYQKGKYKFQIRPEKLGFAVQVEVNAAYLNKIVKK